MLLSGLAISALNKDIQQILPHQDFLVPIFLNTLLSEECHEQAASDCLSILVSLCSHNPAIFQKLAQERRFVRRLLEFLKLSLDFRFSTDGDRLAKLQEQVLTLLAQLCEHPVIGLKMREKLMANVQLIAQKVNVLSLKVALAAIHLLRVLTSRLEIFTDFLELDLFHREIVSIAIIAFNNFQGGRFEMDEVKIGALLASSLLLIAQFCKDSEVGERVITQLVELIDRTDGHFLPLAILHHPQASFDSAIAITSALYILYCAAASPIFQLSLTQQDLDLLKKLRNYRSLARVASAIIDMFV